VGRPIPQGKPTWALVNLDSAAEPPIIGQFNAVFNRTDGNPIWSKRPGLMGGRPWLSFVGAGSGMLSFSFIAIATHVLDTYPMDAWNKLQEWAKPDPVLGRPPRVLWTYGRESIEGYITKLPTAQIKMWESVPAVHTVGPVMVEITEANPREAQLPSSTAFVTNHSDLTAEGLANRHLGDARYGASLRTYNQGVPLNGQLEVPRASSVEIVKVPTVSPFMRTDDDIEGL